MEFITPVKTWHDWSEIAREIFRVFRNPEVNRQVPIEDNTFIEQTLPMSVVRPLSGEEMDAYRAPFLKPEDRERVLRWPNELPIEREPADVGEIGDAWTAWLLGSEVPKLFFSATHGDIISVEGAEWWAKTLKNTKSVGIGLGVHYVQEDHPHLIGKQIAGWLDTVIRN